MESEEPEQAPLENRRWSLVEMPDNVFGDVWIGLVPTTEQLLNL